MFACFFKKKIIFFSVVIVCLSNLTCTSEKNKYSAHKQFSMFDALKDSMQKDQSELIIHCIENGYDFDNQCSDTGKNLLHYAAQMSALNCVQLLLQTGVKIDQQDNEGKTPLHLAAYWNIGDGIVRLLVESGADTFMYDKSHKLPLDFACSLTMRSLLLPPKIDITLEGL